MRLSVKSKNGTATDAFRQYAEKKLQKLDRHFRRIDSADLQVSTVRGQHTVELTIEGDDLRLRSEERSGDLFAAVDSVVDKVERQVTGFRTRRRQGHRRPDPAKAAAPETEADELVETGDDGEEPALRIVRRKRFPMKPMPAEEAARHMELLDHTFFLFLNDETGQMNLLYRRRDGGYGLIEPEQ